jgi:serine/threonine protein kinase
MIDPSRAARWPRLSFDRSTRRATPRADMAAAEQQKYRVIKRLEAGGMAEVYLGEAVSVQGFKKKVAIKRVLPHLAQNQAFIEMFLDEARLSAKLDHANIVSVFDISKREDTYFLIMEFVDGVNLKRILEALGKRGQRMRLVDAVYLCIECLRGLSYAHELHDEGGAPLGIVHRDISPPNIMVTRRGEVKLADFGLAKASTQIQTTDPGVVKGKFSYLSPEAAAGGEVDARADVFAIGIVLWEMLAGKRLFWGENDYATVKLIQKANVPRLSPLNREVDERFEEVLLKALTRDPKDRYQSARLFCDALADYLFSHQMMVTAYDLARLVQSVTGEDAPAPAPANDPSLIDRLIQDELDESVGISSESGSMPKAGGSAESLTLGGGEGFEDPASWFSDADLSSKRPPAPLQQAAVAPPAPKPKPAAAPVKAHVPRGDEPSGSWRESGIDEPDAPDTTPDDPTEEDIEISTSESDAPPSAASPLPSVAPEVGARAAGGGSATKIVVAIVIAAAVAAAAYLGLRP